MHGEKRGGIDAFWLKLAACFTMLADHSFVLIPDLSIGGAQLVYHVLRTVGRLAFPIFAFQISEGFRHTSDPRKYALRLLLFGVITQPIFMACFDTGSMNTLFTLLLGLLAGFSWKAVFSWKACFSWKGDALVLRPRSGVEYGRRILNALVCIGVVWLAECFDTDYGAWGAMLVFIFIALGDRKRVMLVCAGVMMLIYSPETLLEIAKTAGIALLKLIGRGEELSIGMGKLLSTFFEAARIAVKFVALWLIAAYNGKQGRRTGIFPYIFYPAHLLLLYFIKLLAI